MDEPTVSYQDEVVEMEAIDPLALDGVDVKQPLQTSQSYDQSLQNESILQNVVEETHDPAVIPNDCKDVVMDYTSKFITQEVFKTKEEMAEWLRVVSCRNGFVIVIKRSKLSESKRKPTIIYSCERGGQYRSNMKQIEGNPAKKKRKTGTKKCECPFALTAKMENKEGWVLTVKCGVHNHPAALNLVGHSYAGRLNEKEKGVLKEMTPNLVLPTSIFRTLKSMDQSNLSTLRQIYNMRHKLRVLDMAGRSQMHHFLHNLSEGNYIEWHWRSGEINEMLDIFWTHPFNLALLRTFPTVLLRKYQASRQDTLSLLPSGVFVSQGRGRSKSESSQGKGQGIGKGKETPKSVRQTGYLKSFNPIMLPFIRDIIDVEPDRNCGFRYIVGLMGFGEGQWARVCKDLLTELQKYPGMYKDVFQVDGRVDEVAYRLDHYSPRATSKHWFCFPEMGYLAASAYNCVLHLFGKYQSLTFLQLRVAPVEIKEWKIIAMRHVNENHFVQVYLHPDYPWYNYCLPVAFPWADAYQDYIHTYKALVEPQLGTNEVISLDSD